MRDTPYFYFEILGTIYGYLLTNIVITSQSLHKHLPWYKYVLRGKWIHDFRLSVRVTNHYPIRQVQYWGHEFYLIRICAFYCIADQIERNSAQILCFPVRFSILSLESGLNQRHFYLADREFGYNNYHPQLLSNLRPTTVTFAKRHLLTAPHNIFKYFSTTKIVVFDLFTYL